jgi:copper transport protein
MMSSRRCTLLLTLFLEIGLFLIFPGKSLAHATLLRSDPAKDAVLPIAPHQIRMWFSEELNASLSTAMVVDEANGRVESGQARVSTIDPTRMDLNFKAALLPAVYTVIYRSVADDDGHILAGSFLFTVARPDGMVPTLRPGTRTGANIQGTTNVNGQQIGQFDSTVLFNLLMITLVELGAVFYVAAAIWHLFVLRPTAREDSAREEANQRARQRFEQRLAVPLLCVLLAANSGVLIGQAITVTGGNWGTAFAPTLLVTLSTSGHFGLIWLIREIVLVLALSLAWYQWRARWRSPRFTTVLSWIHLLVGLAFFLALTLSSHASAVGPGKVIVVLIADWLHLIAAALWVGGMLYLALSYLPVQRKQSIAAQAHALTTVLPAYSPWAVVGVIMMAITGPLSATVHLTSWEQALTTAYGRALIVKVMLVGGLLLTSAIHVLLLRPRLNNAYRKYRYVLARLQVVEKVSVGALGAQHGPREVLPSIPLRRRLASQVHVREGRLARQTRLLTHVLSWEPVLGVAVLICVGAMNVFAGTLSPVGTLPQQRPSLEKTQVVHLWARTSDHQCMVKLDITPDQIGSNVFLASVENVATGKAMTNIGVSLSTSSLDMDMGTDTMKLQPDRNSHFRSVGDLTMRGHWQIRIQIRTLDNTLHEALVKLRVP